MASDDQPTCGKGLAANAVLPARLGELMAARAEVLERHMKALDPTEPTALYNLAAANEKLLNHRAARGYIQKYRAGDPEHEEGVNLAIQIAEASGFTREVERIKKEAEERKQVARKAERTKGETPEDEPPAGPEGEADQDEDERGGD